MNSFTAYAQSALNRSLPIARELGHTYVGTEHLLLGLLGQRDSVASGLLSLRGVTYEGTRERIIRLTGQGDPTHIGPADMTPRLRAVIEGASAEAMQSGKVMIGTEHLLLAMLREGDCVGVRLLTEQGVPVRELTTDIRAFLSGGDLMAQNLPPSPPSDRTGSEPSEAAQGNLLRKNAFSPVGSPLEKTTYLKQYGRDLTLAAREGRLDPVIGREKETERVLQILSRRMKNNPCLIGEPGVGKTAVVEGLAQRLCEGSVPTGLAGYTVVALDLAGMVAGARYRGDFEERLRGVIEEAAKTPGILLFLDEVHTLMGAGASEGAFDAASLLKPALARGEVRLIGATTPREYSRHLERDAALLRRFQPIRIEEPTREETRRILLGARERLEAHHGITIPDEAIDEAIDCAARYLPDRFFPDKALDLIDEAAARMRVSGAGEKIPGKKERPELSSLSEQKEEAIRQGDFEKAAKLHEAEEKADAERRENEAEEGTESHPAPRPILTRAVITEVVAAMTGIPAEKITEAESERLLRLEERMKERIIGQDEAISAVAGCIRRGRLGLRDPDRPVGSFLFLGPTGVGKTETARTLAELLYGGENALIRLDMSEYMEKHSVSRLIGSPPGYVGYGEGGLLTEAVRRHPYAVVLFDEMEKAHPDVCHLLLQILEEGTLTDAQGRKADFRHTVIILTGNAGAGQIQTPMGFGSGVREEERKREAQMESLSGIFRPELLGRLDEIVWFRPLGEEALLAVTRLLLKGMTERLHALGIGVTFTDALIRFLTLEGRDPSLGARPLRHRIDRTVGEAIAKKLLGGSLHPGNNVTADVSEDGQVMIK